MSKKANTGKNTHFTNSFAAGTYAYSSPEQLKGEDLRFNTDLWAYGAIVYEIFTGKTMFTLETQKPGSSALNTKEILDLIFNSDISLKIAELPSKWQPVVVACLNRDANSRVKTGEELLSILKGKTTASSTKATEIISLKNRTSQGNDFSKAKTEILGKTETEKADLPKQDNVVEKKSSKAPLYIVLGILLFAIIGIVFWQSNKTETVSQETQPILISDSVSKTDSVAIANVLPKEDSSISEIVNETPAWKTTFDSKWEILKNSESKNTNTTNLKNYQDLLKILPSEAASEREKVQDRIGFYSHKDKITEPKHDTNWREKYDKIGDFSEGLAVVKLKSKWGFVDKAGKEVIPLKYDEVADFYDGLALVKLNDKRGLINKLGKVVIPIKYDNIRGYNEGFASVCLNQKCGFVDRYGKVVIPLKFDYLATFQNGFAEVVLNNIDITINKKGECVKDCP